MENADAHRIYLDIEDLLGVANGAAADTKDRLDTLNQKADTVIGLLRDIRDLMALGQTTGNTLHHRSQAVVDAARSEGRWITDRT